MTLSWHHLEPNQTEPNRRSVFRWMNAFQNMSIHHSYIYVLGCHFLSYFRCWLSVATIFGPNRFRRGAENCGGRINCPRVTDSFAMVRPQPPMINVPFTQRSLSLHALSVAHSVSTTIRISPMIDP